MSYQKSEVSRLIELWQGCRRPSLTKMSTRAQTSATLRSCLRRTFWALDVSLFQPISW